MTRLPPALPDALTRAPDPDRGPSFLRLVLEAGTPLQIVRLLRCRDDLREAPRADDADGGRPVIAIPGWFTPELSMAPLRRYLSWLGHDARTWGRGHNTSQVIDQVRGFVPEVRRAAEQCGRPVALVGWSLGGLVAREVARDAPDAVDRIVTIGAPAVGGPRWTSVRHLYPRSEIRWFQEAADARSAFPIRRPITSIVSKRDGVIHWRAQVDRRSPHVEHVEVRSTHVGMAYDPDVWLATAKALTSA